MNQGPSDMYYSSHLSVGQAPAPQTVTSGSMGHYGHQQQPPLLQPGPGQYSNSSAPYGQYGNYSNGLASPHQPLPQSNILSLPSLTSAPPAMPGQGYGAQQGQHAFDTTGQIAPPGMKPRVTATLWEDEGSLCFQVEAKGICVARREDNHMINGTKLLNVAGMTRGRRDGILKSEKVRHVIKIGPMHLKGVWIPYERALDFANKEKITEILYPLFVSNINQLLAHPSNSGRSSNFMAASERRKQEQNQLVRSSQAPGLPSMQPHHHHSIPNGLPGPQHGVQTHAGMGRPDMQRSHTFPTPPTSASGVIGSLGNSDNSFQWPGQGMNSSNGLAIDTSLSNTRSMPTTPATTPPGASMQGMHQYQQTSQSYDPSRHQMYSAPALQQGSYQQTNASSSGMNRYPHSNTFVKSEMGPPTTRVSGTGTDSDHHDVKVPNGLIHHGQSSDHINHGQTDEEADHENVSEYPHDNNSYESARSGYTYPTAPTVATLSTDQSHLSPEMTGSPTHQSGSGRATPRTTATNQTYYSQNQAGYSTPPRVQPPSSNLYSVMSSERATVNGSSNSELYGGQQELGNTMNNGYGHQQGMVGHVQMSNKRGRDDNDDQRPISRDPLNDLGGLKRRRTIREDGPPVQAYDSQMNRSHSAISQRRR